jgi:hypothetical protein
MAAARKRPRPAPPAERTLLGWSEYIRLPDWELSGLRAKIDTGALSSAIDVSAIEPLGKNRVRFKVVKDRNSNRRRTVEAKIIRRTEVRPSFGESQVRIFVATRVVLAGQTLTVEFGLVDRGRLHCRALIGRRDLAPFTVDPSHCYLHGRATRRTPARS